MTVRFLHFYAWYIRWVKVLFLAVSLHVLQYDVGTGIGAHQFEGHVAEAQAVDVAGEEAVGGGGRRIV